MAKILIIGCGSIGIQLAEVLMTKGHQVVGFKRNPPINEVATGIVYFKADISSSASLTALSLDFDFVYFIVSPDGRNQESYEAIYNAGINNLLAHFSQAEKTPQWFFISSTSVYGQTQGEWVDESSPSYPENITSQLIRSAEQRLMDLNANHVIVRFSGIYGPGREYLLRMAKQVPAPAIQQTPPYYTNRIHQADCVGVLVFLLECRLAGKALKSCYVASDDDPATTWEVMSWLAERMNTSLPSPKVMQPEADMNKRCNNQRLKALGYQFSYPSYKEGYAELIDNRRV
ncbi:MAG: NAD-dependent epimerase/dehydratase family protein [Methylococcales bacterium]